jgi:predicted DCC family thiol-disulfide oxidoreductase YuxK
MSVTIIGHWVSFGDGEMGSRPDSENSDDRIVFYDGYCVLCSKSVDFILSRDHRTTFRFASLQSDFSKNILTAMGYPVADIQNLSNIVYLRNNVLKIKSDAVLSILWDLGGIYKISFLVYLLPRVVRDFAYDRIAKLRYRIFGKRDTCRVPTPQEMARFLG